MKSMSQLAVLSRRWRPSEMKLDSFQEVVLESSSVEELKEKVKCLTRCKFIVISKSLFDVFCWEAQKYHSYINLFLGYCIFFFSGTENVHFCQQKHMNQHLYYLVSRSRQLSEYSGEHMQKSHTLNFRKHNIELNLCIILEKHMKEKLNYCHPVFFFSSYSKIIPKY